MNDCCIINYGGGSVGYSRTHTFYPYKTLFLRKLKYVCGCGKKISSDEYEKYIQQQKILDIVIKQYMKDHFGD